MFDPPFHRSDGTTAGSQEFRKRSGHLPSFDRDHDQITSDLKLDVITY